MLKDREGQSGIGLGYVNLKKVIFSNRCGRYIRKQGVESAIVKIKTLFEQYLSPNFFYTFLFCLLWLALIITSLEFRVRSSVSVNFSQFCFQLVRSSRSLKYLWICNIIK